MLRHLVTFLYFVIGNKFLTLFFIISSDEDERSENQSGGKDKLMCEMRDRLNMVGLSYASYNAESGRDFAVSVK